MASKGPTKAEKARQTKVIKWATTYGAPIRILVGWNPDDGTWEEESPVAKMVRDIEKGTHIGVAGRRWHLEGITEMQYKGAEFAGTSEDRMQIPVEQRVFVDLYRVIEVAESSSEIELSSSVYEKALKDGKLGLDFLSRRWPNRWKEMQVLSMLDEDDMRERAVSKLIQDPENAMALAAMADAIEDDVEDAERPG
jgi:hypothetical protein